MAQISATRPRTEVVVNDFIRSVYNWMAIGLALTGFVALYVSSSETMLRLIFGNPLIFFVLILAELGLVFSIAGMVNRMSAGTATSLFVLYSTLNGVTLSFIFLAYTRSSIVSTFFICAGTFIGCSIYGWTTKKDLTSWGGFLMMGLIGIIIASLVNMFIRSSGMSMIISYIGVIVFVGLTAYDTQKLKNMALTQPADLDGAVIRKGAILGALSLYLDFINLFLMLLRIFGTGRD
ncbi:MAG: Bax inhibitor-1/YccA family protein [Deltaproteobacteria bacterium]|nr:Bax inhibitor-1/YccA family protein [Deltaproteobacteria bacterium]MBW1736237.1 Bax inhibitor-1/YccA family protein [Deltaproteobacteria bacterium]MBW1908520.1 Bax inhibitor-1/YccA family protein [Deltaproteobacteria bacterium]MBW2032377.1 Bax inhibitor-1/YccA family protein [Deltaproteobacteria bacterium]MBW2113592.1 Bax inhibitor-1/YccA family protein [Deltaproteobacteria bacterium]